MDTSGPVAGVAVLRDGQVAYEAAAVNSMTHSVSLMPMVEEALTRSSLGIGDIDLYAAVTGPGSFTGVRIGVSVVKGMAHGAGKPCLGIDALEALAAGVSLEGALLCPIQDARAGQVYGAAFEAGMPPRRRLENTAQELSLFVQSCLEAAQSREKLCFVGDGIPKHRSALTALLGERACFLPAHLSYLRPASVAMLAQAYADRAGDYLALQPQYLRAPQAERARDAARRKAEKP